MQTTWKGPLTPGGFRRGKDWRASVARKAPRQWARFTGSRRELKFFDTAQTWNVDLTGEVVSQLCLIPQGDTESTRDGRKATIKSVQLRGTLLFQPTTDTAAVALCYLALVLDTQCNGAAAGISDIFTSSAMDRNFIQLNNSGRFRILWKKTYNMFIGAGVTTGYNDCLKAVEMYKRCNIPIDWNSTTGAITEIRSNNIFLVAGSNGVDDKCVFIGNARVRFVG